MHVIYDDTPSSELSNAIRTLGERAFVVVHEGFIVLSVDKALVVEFLDHFRRRALALVQHS